MSNQTIQPLGVVPEKIAEVPIVLQGRLSASMQRLANGHLRRDDIRIVDLRSCQKVIEYCSQDQVISVETGMTLKQLNAVTAPNQQIFPCSVSDDHTILEIINEGDNGSLEHAFGLRSMVLGLQVVLADGRGIKTGGKVVKNVTGYDLTKLFLGGRGSYGIPAQAHLRLYATQEKASLFVISGLDVVQSLALSRQLLTSGLPLAAVDLCMNVRARSELPESILAVYASEHHQIMDEMQQILGALFVEARAHVQIFQDADAEAMLLSINSSLPWEGLTVEVTVPRSMFKALSDALDLSHSSLCAHYRIGVGRLKLKAENADQLSILLGSLRNFARLQPIVIAYTDEQFDYRVERLPDNHGGLDKILQSIKSKFDPENRMNPFVKL